MGSFSFIREKRDFRGKECDWIKATFVSGNNTIIAGVCLELYSSESEAVEAIRNQMLSKMQKLKK